MDARLSEDLQLYQQHSLVRPEWLDNPVRNLLLKMMVHGAAPSFEEAEAAMDEVGRYYAGQQHRANLEQLVTLSAVIAMKGAPPEAMAGLATSLMRWQSRVQLRSDDAICASGMGGDRFKTVNVSSPASVISSAAGARLAKFGSRASTGLTGSSDWFEAAGVNLAASAESMAKACDELGFGYFEFTRYCPSGVLAFKTLVPSLFHWIAPMAHPCNIRGKVCGANNTQWQDLAGEAFRLMVQRGTLRHDFRALIVAGLDAQGQAVVDEVSSFGPTRVVEVRDGQLRQYMIRPEDLGLRTSAPEEVRARPTREQNIDATLRVLRGEERGPVRDILVLNAAALLYTASVVPTLAEGVQAALAAVESGAALRRLEQLSAVSRA